MMDNTQFWEHEFDVNVLLAESERMASWRGKTFGTAKRYAILGERGRVSPFVENHFGDVISD
jgi:hypothetical protein